MQHAVSSVVAAAIGIKPGFPKAEHMPLANRQHMQLQHGLSHRQQHKEQEHSVVTDVVAAAVHRAAALKMRREVVRR
jgi:hypothetical protein